MPGEEIELEERLNDVENDGDATQGRKLRSPITMNHCKVLTKIYRDEASKCEKYKFDYSDTAFNKGFIEVSRTEPSMIGNKNKNKTIRAWQELYNLKVANEWDTIRHPYILHYVNQILLDCSPFYAIHVIAALLLFILLALHIVSPNLLVGILIVAITSIFSTALFYKSVMNTRNNLLSKWFVLGAIFNFLTYLATFAYIMLPLVFSWDDFAQETKKVVKWFLPIVAIVAAYINLLYVLRKSPFGIYVLMMKRIFKSFGSITVIWIPTLITFSFVFLLVMRDTGVTPWPPTQHSISNSSLFDTFFDVFQAVAKTSTMMLGEVDANDILQTKQWIPCILVLVFEVITIILLMNLMVSLAVGDVNDLKEEAEEKMLKIKLNYVIEALQLSEVFKKTYHTKNPSNGLVIHDNGEYILREVKDNWWMIFSKWLIGLNMAGYLKNSNEEANLNISDYTVCRFGTHFLLSSQARRSLTL